MTQTSSPETTQTEGRAAAPEIITVPADTDNVMCDGGHGALGHPAVYYRFDGQNKVVCGYCDREFVKES